MYLYSRYKVRDITYTSFTPSVSSILNGFINIPITVKR